MGNKVRSARGIEVDFDLLKIKQQIADAPAVNVANREAFVEKRLRRRPKRSVVPAAVVKTPELEPELLESEELAHEPLEDVLMDEITPGREPAEEPTVRPVRKVK